MLYTLKQFIKHGIHFGHYKWECDYRLSYFLLGIRNELHIINLYYTLFVLKQALYIAYNMCFTGQKILIVNNIGYKLDSNFEKINQKYLWYINSKWTCGLLSNQRGLFLNNENLFLEFYGVGYSSLLPSFVFASNVKETTSCIFESIILNIPSSALIDSNMGLYGVFYGLPSNDDNFLSVYMFTKLFIKMYLKSVFDNLNSLKIEKNINNLEGIKSLRWKMLRNKRFKLKLKRLNKRFRFFKKKTWRKYPWGANWLHQQQHKLNISKVLFNLKIQSKLKKTYKIQKKKKNDKFIL